MRDFKIGDIIRLKEDSSGANYSSAGFPDKLRTVLGVESTKPSDLNVQNLPKSTKYKLLKPNNVKDSFLLCPVVATGALETEVNRYACSYVESRNFILVVNLPLKV